MVHQPLTSDSTPEQKQLFLSQLPLTASMTSAE